MDKGEHLHSFWCLLIGVPQVVELDDIEVIVLHRGHHQILLNSSIGDPIHVWAVLGGDLRR